MSAIYYKTVKGRKYAYRCLKSWRDESGKVHKQEQYLGAVEPVNRVPIMARLPIEAQNKIRDGYEGEYMKVSRIQTYVEEITGEKPSASTVYNFLRGGKHV